MGQIDPEVNSEDTHNEEPKNQEEQEERKLEDWTYQEDLVLIENYPKFKELPKK